MIPFHWPIRVYYEDTDAGGVVYYANYLRFLERARTECLRDIGFEQDQMRAEFGVVFAVRSLEIEYNKPALFNQRLDVCVDDITLRPASMIMQQSIAKLTGTESELISTAVVKVACVDSENFSPCAIPKPIYKVLMTCI